MATNLFTNQTANGTSSSHAIERSSAMLFIWGTWDGANVEVQMSYDDTNYISDADLTFTASGVRNLHVCPVPPGAYFRAVLASAGTATDITCVISD